MIKKIPIYLLILIFAVANSCTTDLSHSDQVDRLPVIFPDYTGIVIPPNMAPLNFVVKEKGDLFVARISVKDDLQLTVESTDGIIDIDIDKWHGLLHKAKGGEIHVAVFVRGENGRFQQFKTIINRVANEEIDNHLVYRLINTGYVMWSKMGIYQRNLENFDESAVIDNQTIGNTCVNCHSFSRNNPKSMMVHVRATNAGTVIYDDGKLKKINSKTKYTLSPGAYPNWHPDGKHIAYSVNNISQRFFSKDIRIEVTDAASDIIVYDTRNDKISTSPQVSTGSRENLPNWSPDGKYLYYISAPGITDYESEVNTRYSLMRIPYDAEKNSWGKADTVISASELGKSITFPKLSPDGKYLMFTAAEHGYFTIHYPDADLYLLNLETGEYKKMDINSPKTTDSYHCWSSSGRWFVFSSKRLDELFTRPFFCYFDADGNPSKPFVLPQKNPEFYDSFLINYNIPELITGAVEPSPFDLRELILSGAKPVSLDDAVDTVFMRDHLKKK